MFSYLDDRRSNIPISLRAWKIPRNTAGFDLDGYWDVCRSPATSRNLSNLIAVRKMPSAMKERPPEIEGIKSGDRLPRGKHGIPPELVVAHQRERLFGAVAKLVGEHGYAGLRVGSLLREAKISSDTFYSIFRDKLDCLLAAHRASFEHLREIILAACDDADDWPSAIAGAVEAALQFGASSPDQFRLIFLATHEIFEPALVNRTVEVEERLAELMIAGRRGKTKRPPNPALTEREATRSVLSAVAARVERGEFQSLPQLAPELIRLVSLTSVADR